MMARPTWVRRLYYVLAVLSVLALLAICYGYFQLTASVIPDGVGRANVLDAQEAEKKLKLYMEAQKISRPGFVRLSEVEINSYLQRHYFSDSNGGTQREGARLVRTQAVLSPRAIIWYCWVEKDWLGCSTELVWQRTFELGRAKDGRCTFNLKAMKVGRVKVPKPLWDTVETSLGNVDGMFTDRFDWVTQMPALELKTNAASFKPELRLFTYRVSETR
jgi:hypothetical protein